MVFLGLLTKVFKVQKMLCKLSRKSIFASLYFELYMSHIMLFLVFFSVKDKTRELWNMKSSIHDNPLY